MTNYYMTKKRKLMLASMATNPNAKYMKVQIQAFFFLVDKNTNADGNFAFVPEAYIPCDEDIYKQLDVLNKMGLVHIELLNNGMRSLYSLSDEGVSQGTNLFENFDQSILKYAKETSEYVHKISFKELVSDMNLNYPHMTDYAKIPDWSATKKFVAERQLSVNEAKRNFPYA